MTETRIAVVGTAGRNTIDTAALLLTEMLDHVDDWRVDVHSIRRPALPGENRVTGACEVIIVALRILATALRCRRSADVVVVNKTLAWDPVDAVFDRPLYERVFLSLGTTVYATMDADYVSEPTKTSVLFENADLVLATSRAIYDEATSVAPSERVVLVPPCVDTDFFTPMAEARPHDERLVLGWVGSADHHTDTLRHLVTCLEQVPPDDVSLRLLLGGGSLPEDVRHALEELGFDVDVVEYVPRAEVPAVINSFDVGLVPLRDTEFDRGKSSQKVREYMACGVPVLASDVGENRHLVPEHTGLLASGPGDWAEAVSTLLDGETRAEMGERARDHVESEYAVPVVAARLEAAFDRIL